MQTATLTITLGKLAQAFSDDPHYSFFCFAAEKIIYDEVRLRGNVNADSAFFWGELHRIDPELFASVASQHIEEYRRRSHCLDYWINPACYVKFPFIRDHCRAPVSHNCRAFRLKLLALLLERHGADLPIMFKYELT